jgi:type IV pilus assembly protein PilE
MAGRYAFDFVNAPNAAGFEVRATPQNIQAARDGLCATMTVNQAGVRTISGTGTVDRCW